MKHPHFVMSKFLKESHLYEAKAKYFEAKYNQLEADVIKILELHKVSAVDYEAMRSAEKTVNEDNDLTGGY